MSGAAVTGDINLCRFIISVMQKTQRELSDNKKAKTVKCRLLWKFPHVDARNERRLLCVGAACGGRPAED